ncbi:MAG: hypothetical protein JHC95_12840 [Solirubrobacteraceae bacterium]|nr:hypothetical protein [Solirubrobacteraceae bacterium]
MNRFRSLALVGVAAAGLALGACGSSPEDDARDEGKNIGEAIAEFQTADSAEEAGAAIDDFNKAREQLSEDTRERVADQVETQGLNVQALVQAYTADPSDANAQALKNAANELRSQAQAFQSANNSTAVAFWEGVEEGYDDEID